MIFDIDKAASIHIPPAMATTDEFNLTELHLLAPTIHNLAITSLLTITLLWKLFLV